MLRYLPLVLAVVVVAAASSWDFMINTDLEGRAEAWKDPLPAGVPMEIGPWVGKDTPVDEKNALIAGAVARVSRHYRNEETGESVDLWLIVGPMQAIVRHEPPVCYRGQGFAQQEQRNRHTFEVEGHPSASFWTSWFLKEDSAGVPIRRRVFWAWALPEDGGPVAWSAPDYARHEFPGAKALFKLYFTTNVPLAGRDMADDPSNELAKLMLPIINDLLSRGPDGSATPAGDPSPEPTELTAAR